MALSLAHRSSLLRWLSLALLAAAAVKVFAYELWRLERGYRIVSFIALGVLLLAVSFVETGYRLLRERARALDSKTGNR